jgi:hypothetical protein
MASKKPKLGLCNLCREFRQLTDEHIPPQSAGNDKWAACHNLYGFTKGVELQKAPLLLERHGGITRRTLCEPCNQATARHYNAAFANWTLQALTYAAKVGAENSVYLTFRSKPLRVLKQIMTMAIAATDVSDSPFLRSYRRFVLQPFSREFPPDLRVAAYLNPLRSDRQRDKLLTQNRMTGTCAILDIEKGTSVNCFAEIAFPPMGYLLHTLDNMRITEEAAELADISFFATFQYDDERNVSVQLPVRIPFGPVPGYYPKMSS